MKRSYQSGMTLIEMIILFSIAGIIITFSIVNFSDVLWTSELLLLVGAFWGSAPESANT